MHTEEWAIAHATHTFNVSADAVFDAWVNPDLIWQWGAGAVSESANRQRLHR